MKFIFLVATIIFSQLSYSQTLPNFEEISLKQPSDYKSAEPNVLTAANYIFSTPVKEDNPDRKMALSFIIRWMSGTPDFNFELGASDTKISKGSPDIFGLQMAAMSKYVIENPANAKDKQLVRDNSLDMVVQYCQKPENNIKMTKALKKYAEERGK
jgi:hypothetical protein